MADADQTDGTFKDWLNWLQLLAHVSTVIALVMLWVQMNAASKSERIKNTLGYVERLHAEPISSYQGKLDRMLAPYASDFADMNCDGCAKPTRDDLDLSIIYPAIEAFDAANSKGSALESISQMTRFYDHLVICADENSCDQVVVDRYFKKQLIEFWNNFETVILEARKGETTGLGEPLEGYVKANRREGKK